MLVVLHLVSLTFAKNQPASLATPLYFEPNQGQFPAQVLFAVRGPGPTAWITDREILLDVPGGRIAFGPGGPAKARGVDAQPGTSSYFVGQDRSKWVRNVPSYSRAILEGIYPGIDIVFYGAASGLEYDFVIHPGADPSRIHVDFDPRLKPRQDPATGEITLEGGLRHRVPKVHQDGREVAFLSKLAANSLRFEIPDYDAQSRW